MSQRSAFLGVEGEIYGLKLTSPETITLNATQESQPVRLHPRCNFVNTIFASGVCEKDAGLAIPTGEGAREAEMERRGMIPHRSRA